MVIKDPETLRLILETFSHLDEIRWSVKDNYNLINCYCGEGELNDDEKLLTHWLCYVMDRRTRFQRVWEVGGYVVSHMVRAYKDGRGLDELRKAYVQEEPGKVRLKCPLGEDADEDAKRRLARYMDGKGMDKGTATFASRYTPDDVVKMFRTLHILAKHYERSLAGFIAASYKGENDDRIAIRRMAVALDGLTYPVERVSVAEFGAAMEKMQSAADKFTMPTDVEREMFNRKCLWCCVRDYLKSPEFNPVFVHALEKCRAESPERWNIEGRKSDPNLRQALDALELPGDVWNNSAVVRDGLFAPRLGAKPKSWSMPQTIRAAYTPLSEERLFGFYPEQLDVTFDFVPQMCVRGMCDVCLFGGGIEQVCHGNPDLLCPVALTSCGYRHKCDPKCQLKDNRAMGSCKFYTERLPAQTIQ